MRKMTTRITQMINTSKIHELITYFEKFVLSILSQANMRATFLRFVECENQAFFDYATLL